MLTFLLLGFINPSNEIISYFTKFGGAELIRTRCEAEPFLSSHAQGTHHPYPLGLSDNTPEWKPRSDATVGEGVL